MLEESYSGQPANAPLSGLLPGNGQGSRRPDGGQPSAAGHPPADGYPDGNATPSIKPGETLVMVVDLLFTQSQ